MAKGKKPTQIKSGASPLKALWDGIGNLIDIVADMDKKGVNEFVRQRTVQGKTASGKDMRGEYSVRVRTGLDAIREKEQGEDKPGEK